MILRMNAHLKGFSDAPKQILIAGCGDVGSALGLRLVAAGHEVTGVRRRAGDLPPRIQGVSADLTDPETLRTLPRDVRVLVYSATADGFSEEAYRRAYLQGMENVLAALHDAPLERILFTSSTSVYAQDDGSWVNEDSPTRPAGFSGRILLQTEALVSRHGAECGAQTCAVRFGGIYGPGRTRLLDRVRAGAGCDPRTHWTNRIHRDDCAGVLAHLVQSAHMPPVVLAVDCEPAPRCRVMDWMAEQLQCERPPRTEGGVRRRGGNKRCSNRRLLASGYRFRYPSFREGYTSMLAAGLRRPHPSGS